MDLGWMSVASIRRSFMAQLSANSGRLRWSYRRCWVGGFVLIAESDLNVIRVSCAHERCRTARRHGCAVER